MKSILTLTLAALLVLGFCTGCEEGLGQKGPGMAKRDIKNVLNKWQSAYKKQDIDGIMSVYSEEYVGSQGEEKSQVREFIEGMVDQGAMNSLEMNIDEAKIKVKGDTATVAPISYSGDWGEIKVQYTFKKEGSSWRTISSEEYYGDY